MYRYYGLTNPIWRTPDPGEMDDETLDGGCSWSCDGLLCTRDENHLMPHRAGVGLAHDFSREQAGGKFPYAAEWDNNRSTDVWEDTREGGRLKVERKGEREKLT